jgi:zinc and cadmium transporter
MPSIMPHLVSGSMQVDPALGAIVLTTTLAGAVSISAAAFISFTLLEAMAERMLSLSVGVMLATSLLHALPEAMLANGHPQRLCATLLTGLLTFFLLEKGAIVHAAHCHGNAAGAHPHAHGAARSGWMVLAGDALHNFTDGIMIAAAFLADPGLGVLTGLAIVAHEIPQEIGDFVVLLNAGFSRARAYLFNLLCSAMGLAGGIVGYLTLGRAGTLVPYVITFASAGFLYVAISHLMPQLQRKDTLRDALPQLALIAAGIFGVLALVD